MDDDGRSGRWMARGNMGKLTHLEAFLSDDAKWGRVWTCGKIEYKRGQTQWPEVMHREAGCGVWNNYPWQLAESTEKVYWADELKTPTPREVLRALADGKCIEKDGIVYKTGQAGNFLSWYRTGRDTYAWKPLAISGLAGFRIVPDPSQPAESAHREHMVDAAIYAAKSIAEPQVEYPLTFEDACLAAKRGALVTNERYPYVTYGIINGVRQVRSETKGWRGDDWGYSQTERGARWRIVDGGK